MDFASYITGFVDGEGCFLVSFNRRAKLSTNIEVRPSFSVAQNKRSLNILKDIQDFFSCGGIRFSKSDQVYKYEVRSLNDLNKKIIPHFQKHQLQTSKSNDFQIFTKICNMMEKNLHLNKKYLVEIVSQAYQMNPSGKRKYDKQKLLSLIAR
jgi:hypothetical protein